MVKLANSGQSVDLVQPADLIQTVEMAQLADFSSRLSGLKVVIKLNNNIINIISPLLIMEIKSNGQKT